MVKKEVEEDQSEDKKEEEAEDESGDEQLEYDEEEQEEVNTIIIVNIRYLKMQRLRQQREHPKTNRLNKQNNDFACASH